MAHGYYVNHHLVIKYLVDHAIIPNANTPEVFEALELVTARGTGIPSQTLYLGEYSVDDIGTEVFQFFSG
jgi:hypothetical protein